MSLAGMQWNSQDWKSGESERAAMLVSIFSSATTKKLSWSVIIWMLLFSTLFYYMASSMSVQDEPNRTMWLATWVGKMGGIFASLAGGWENLGIFFPILWFIFHRALT